MGTRGQPLGDVRRLHMPRSPQMPWAYALTELTVIYGKDRLGSSSPGNVVGVPLGLAEFMWYLRSSRLVAAVLKCYGLWRPKWFIAYGGWK